MCTFIPKQTKEKMRKIVNVSDHHTEIDRTIQVKSKCHRENIHKKNET